MRWKDNFQKTFDVAYELVKRKTCDVCYPCYGGMYYWFLANQHFTNCFFFMAQDRLIYTISGANLREIPLREITRVQVKRAWLFKYNYHIYIRADKRYHFVLYDREVFTTKRAGSCSENVRGFILALDKKSVH